MEQILTAYYADNARKLHGIVDRILLKFGGILDKDMDDFYSLANEVFVEVMKRYDSSQSFEAFLYSCLSKRIKTEITRRNREKRKADRISVSIDTPVDEEEEITLGDIIADDFSIEREVFENSEESYSRRMLLYLSRLSKLQKEVLKLHSVGYLPNEIREELHISAKQYTECCEAIHSYRNVSVL
ncbi:MAG: hypothetical protein K2O97_07040 [Acetatifactor sp.]|nr:hypothetical protein [Acetatifactor sp.]MDE7044757.1 hypothetical protein [Acetatifactor sp.]